MKFTKKESYAIQLGIYLKNHQFKDACKLSEDMLRKFPSEPLSHFIAAKSYYFLEEYDKANSEGRKAYNLSSTKPDQIASALVTASALFMLGRYQDSYSLISQFQKERHEEVKKLLIMLSMVMRNGRQAAEYYKELHDLNKKAAEKFIRKLAKG